MNSSNPSKGPDKSAIQLQIDENLKRVYEEVLSEDVPDRFKLLLEQLKAQTTGGGKDGE